jgi:hypothetical protein
MDIEGRQFRSLRRQARRMVGRVCPATYIAIPPAESERRLLERARIPYAVCDGSAVIVGRHAEELAPLLHVPRLPILPGGQLPDDDPLARQLASALVDALLPRAAAAGEICAMAVPTTAEEAVSTREWQFFSRLVRLRGYVPMAVERSDAVVLAELGRTTFSGVCLLLESSTSELVLARQGTVLAHAVLPRGGDWIDEQLARKTERIVWDMHGTTYVDVDAVQRWKAETAPCLHWPQNDEVQILAYLYQQLLGDLARLFAARCRSCPEAVPLRSPQVVCCGAATRIDGFLPLLTEQLELCGLPFGVGGIQLVDVPDYSIARGCLIRAELEAQPLQRSA